jgi:NADPH:quinone reductase-like Zn-dependent oxidoreductase
MGSKNAPKLYTAPNTVNIDVKAAPTTNHAWRPSFIRNPECKRSRHGPVPSTLSGVRAAGITESGGPVRPLDVPEPAGPGPDDVVIEVRAAGVANWDEIIRTGGWNVGASPPMALGVEASGVVRAVGSKVSRFRPGDEVLTHAVPLRQGGAWAELFAAPENQVAHKPVGMSFEAAGVFPVPALTAAEVLSQTVMLRADETLFVNGGGGVTGGMVVAVGASLGARVVVTADPRSAERLRGYGASAVVDYHRPDWQAEVRRFAGGAVPVAVNAVRGAAPGLLTLMADGGRLATITNEAVQPERGIGLSGFYVSPDGALLERVAGSFAERRLTIPVAAVYGLADAAAALAAAAGGRLGGGIVIDPRR